SGESFRAVAVKRQWKRVRVLDWLEIPQYRQLEPAECGQRYRAFLRKNGLKSPWTVVALPRSAALLRCLSFPEAVGKELAQAVEYQLDGLHPFEEGSVYWDFAVWQRPEKSLWERAAAEPETASGRLDVLVAIAPKKSVEETTAWFQEAGIGVSQFSATAALLCGAFWSQRADAQDRSLTVPSASLDSARDRPLRTGAARKKPVLFLLHAASGSLELIGCAPGREFLWREIKIPDGATEAGDRLPAAVQRELELARSALRVEPQERPPLVFWGEGFSEALASEDLGFTMVPSEQWFPSLRIGAEGLFRLRENAVGFAAALAAADRSLPLSVNLLPAEKRLYQSPLAHLPTYALASLVVLLAVTLGVRGSAQDWLYGRYLEREIRALQPQLAQVETAQGKSRATLDRLVLLAGVKNSAILPLEILQELTRLLPADTWLQLLQYEGDTVTLSGTATSASGLLPTLAASLYFEGVQFASAINRTPDGKEIFRIALRLRGGRGQ
ncbi:MAG: PilN domain-containing protein, partial [Acidobacteria bacterium]|nr:PilN domain-containing protein [Acidobacteriota bacterium]